MLPPLRSCRHDSWSLKGVKFPPSGQTYSHGMIMHKSETMRLVDAKLHSMITDSGMELGGGLLQQTDMF